MNSCFAWGTDGHATVAQIGQTFLTSTAYNNLLPYLNGNTLADMASWPDNYDHSSAGSWSEPMHYVNLPTNATKFFLEACAPEYSAVGCVVTAIANYSEMLLKEFQHNTPSKCVSGSSSTEPCPLSFVVHFVGDIHQPLHVSYAIDEGGNTVDVEFNSACTNLHSLWDYGLIEYYEDQQGVQWPSMADTLIAFIQENPQIASNWSSEVNATEWATESFERARLEPYNFQPGSASPHSDMVLAKRSSSSCGYVLGVNYYTRNIPYVFDQLMKAGVRLATRLNSIFDPNFQPPMTSFIPNNY